MTDETRTTVTAGEAAKLVGKSVPTITRAIKSGKLSAKPRKPRGWIIEKSELSRAFDIVIGETDNETPSLVDETRSDSSVLQAKLEVMEHRLRDAQATIEDYRARLDAESTERRQLTAQITDQRQLPKRRFFGLLRE
ncbi:MAG: helix-turn-helix domain-containing protein [Paracoccaceae bacterium]